MWGATFNLHHPMKLRQLTPCTLFLSLWSQASTTQHAFQSLRPPLLSSNFSAFAESLLSEWRVPGLALGMVKLHGLGTVPFGEEEIQYEFKSFGDASIGRDGVNSKKVDEDTLFGIASNTKLFTASAIALLVEQGKLNWTTRVHDVLPSFSLQSDCHSTSQVTIADILSHRTGLPRHEHSYQPDESHEDFVNRIKFLKPSAGFRELWQYNNQMFVTAALIIRQLSSVPYTTFISNHFLRPLNLLFTTFHPEANLSSSYLTLENKTIVEIPYGFGRMTNEELEVNAGAGGLVSSTRDMVKWVEFLIRQRRIATDSLRAFKAPPNITAPLSPASVLKISSPQSIQNPVSFNSESSTALYGMGVGITWEQGVELLRHGGSLPGFGSQIFWSSEAGVGIVALCNSDGAGNSVSDIAGLRAFEEIVGLKQLDWNDRYNRIAERQRLKRAKERENWNRTQSKVAEDQLNELVGRYSDPGYGNVTVCGVPHSTSSAGGTTKGGRSTLSECAQLHQSLAQSIPIGPIPPHASLLIHAPGYFSASHVHLRLSNISAANEHESKFDASFGYIFPPTKKGGSSLLCYDEEFQVTFVKEEGKAVRMEWSRGIWGAGNLDLIEKGKQEMAEVVFEKRRDHWGWTDSG